MPESKGRTGRPGSTTTYHNIGIRTAKPDLLQAGKSKGNLSPSSVVEKGKSSVKGKK